MSAELEHLLGKIQACICERHLPNALRVAPRTRD